MARKFSLILSILAIICAGGLTTGLTACSPTMATRGNYLDEDRMKTLQVGVSTKAEVEKTLGSPTTTDPFDPNAWYYIGEKTSTTAFFNPKIDSRKIVVVYFDDQGVLKNAQQVDEKAGKNVEMVKKKTPAPGKEMNAFQQFLDNLGKFNQSGSMSSSQVNPGAGSGPGSR